jgi:hypothetical protein
LLVLVLRSFLYLLVVVLHRCKLKSALARWAAFKCSRRLLQLPFPCDCAVCCQ